jgi:iron complex outermembrane recepter protein
MRSGSHRAALFVGTALGFGVAMSAAAQETPSAARNAGSASKPVQLAQASPTITPASPPGVETIVVTARRREERLQKVPISITVLNQQQLARNNVTNASDLATYVPSLSTTQRFGDEDTTFAIRGFTQELRTTPSVAVYFDDVVAPRGGGSVTGGDGAGPGDFFDLQNVQVLKGPQGTLFGRNTTGGAILLVPQKPTSEYGGYIEASVGNYNMKRLQGVVNLPFSDKVRLRVGFDEQMRDGYLKNTTDIGPSRLNDLDYFSGRASLVVDVTDDIENYTIVDGTRSQDHGSLSQLFACKAGTGLLALFGEMCQNQLNKYGSQGWTVANSQPSPLSEIEQWQAINTTTWHATDDLTVKNIISYAQLQTTLRTDVFGFDFYLPAAIQVTPTFSFPLPKQYVGLPLTFTASDQLPGVPTNSQQTFSEEIQLLGQSFSDRLNWTAGLYYEQSQPLGISGSLSPYLISCSDVVAFKCQDPLGALGGSPEGSVQESLGTITYFNQGAYGQGTYSLTDQLKVTGGIRYTWDQTSGQSNEVAYFFPKPNTPVPECVNPAASLSAQCSIGLKQISSAPTGMIDLEYTPLEDVLLYAKYAGGYRQGSVGIFNAPGYNVWGPEQVNSYEIGTKTSFTAPVRGTFNVTGFYNDFSDQQLQLGFDDLHPTPGSVGVPTTGIVNAGTSTIWGFEVESTLLLLRGLRLDTSYTYLGTYLNSLKQYQPLPPYDDLIPSAVQGGVLTFSPRNKLTLSLNYTLPFPVEIGALTVGTTYVYTDKQLITNSTPFGVAPEYSLLNLNLDWHQIYGKPLDLSLFATNVTDTKYPVFFAGLYDAIGAEAANLGAPLMFGARLRVRF